MKFKKFKKTICLLLSVFMLFSFVACNKDSHNNEEPTEDQKPTAFTPGEEYSIIRSNFYSTDEDITDACFYLKAALKKAYGIKADITTDMAASASGKAFYIGYTNNVQSQQYFNTLAANDYGYYIPSKSTIVIAGVSPETTMLAVEKFCEDLLTYDGKKVQTQNPELMTLTKFTHNETYDYTSLTINDILWEDYTLVVSSGNDLAGAVEINKVFGQYTGYVLPIVQYSDMTGNEESIIRVGAAYRNGKSTQKLKGYLINTYSDESGNVICIDASNKSNYVSAVEDLISKATKTIDGGAVSYNVGVDTVYKVTTTDADGSSNPQTAYMHWELKNETTKTLSEGVTYIEQLYYDDDNLPYRVYTLIVDTNLNRIDMGTSNDGYDSSLPNAADRQTTQQHMQAAVKNGENVIAATNADFFNNRTEPSPGDYAPWGFTIKDGVLLSQKNPERPWIPATGNDRPFFGVDVDGNPLISYESSYLSDEARATLNTAIGGAYILASGGSSLYYCNAMTGKVIHGTIDPHTMVGVCEDGTVVLMVIDGRQPKHSNGASLLQCSILMQRFGSDDVMLLDGGGSSNMVLRDPATDTYTTVNSPDDGHLRKMYNSILVVKKP